ncbi:hypothetical protein V8D89_008626 [Ganoderma adspersum]
MTDALCTLYSGRAERDGIGRALRELRGTTETASPPLSRATGGPSSSRRKANTLDNSHYPQHLCTLYSGRAERDGIGRALRELRGTTETASPPLSRATGKKRSEEPEAREAEREDRPNGSDWKMMKGAGGGGIALLGKASRSPMERAAVAREGERIAEEGVKRQASGRQRRGNEWRRAGRGTERAAVAREGEEWRRE